MPGTFAAKDLFHLDLEAIQIALSELFKKLKVLVGEPETQTKVETKLEAAMTQLPGSASPTGSSQHSHYASATSMADSDTSEGVERMQLGPSGAAMLQSGSQCVPNPMPRTDASVVASRLNENPDRLQTFLNSAMERFLKEQRTAQGMPTVLLIVKCTRGEDEILGTIAASITPRENVDSILSSIAPRKQPRQQAPTVIPSVEPGEELLVVRFGGSARVKRGGGACCANVWKLPEWTVVAAESKYLPDLTVNETEYQGWLLAFDLLSSLDRGHLIICGDSNLVIRQMRGEIECKDSSS
ncbi:hypothetical protein PPTG_24198 [Phytophthora nicotianae INRA-310]|uniref:RNase H type-1 domain-containing protein n=1 Tax=Phytophthora nicotianae (strain INRA-310) TaxID=761204 RepID=W2PIB3_PHYN3|nr:hypothetical protein PPTG_24198 [Phytophthora nicotianae INRA-310]ETN00748.1 hypothetical protein PPTG_24198 [Phytophthora nicotianae INRA-310]